MSFIRYRCSAVKASIFSLVISAKYPKYRANYVRAFDRMLKARAEAGNKINWTSGESVMRWWLGDTTIDGQLSFFDDDEIYDIMSEME
jgi:hypothetical protein